ncbi:helix-turn-helix domain-containing protein [Sessilibacter corallicola]|uniref:helix-turn-helix domain-containing protein n=1 Tax=Sessilibacter corallicola TaxID=2904075 RepID=UPI001E519F5D|nr:helix-turn-helix transcriptional regulator [Sessilibacter corallicola]MCE2027580.1 helix-turn-helix domain-containing protein [Sessilibacter corallicola]
MKPGSTYTAIVGAVIAKEREDRGISQTTIANYVQIGQPAWSRIEKGESALTIDQLARASEGLNISPSEILRIADQTVEKMKMEDLDVSYQKPSRKADLAKSGLLLLGGAALGALVYAAKNNKNEPR